MIQEFFWVYTSRETQTCMHAHRYKNVHNVLVLIAKNWKIHVMTLLQIDIWVWGVSLYFKTLWNFQKHACKMLIVSRIIFLWTVDCGSLLRCACKFILPVSECRLWSPVLPSQACSGPFSRSPFIPRLPLVSPASFQGCTPWSSPSVVVFV